MSGRDEAKLWHIYCIDPDLKRQYRIGSIHHTKEAVAALIGRGYKYRGVTYVIIAAFAMTPGGHLIWNPLRNRYIYDHEIHCLRVMAEDE